MSNRGGRGRNRRSARPEARPRRHGPEGRGKARIIPAAAVALGLVIALGAGLRGSFPPRPAPDFSLTEAGGGRLSPADFRGRPLVLVFFRTFTCAVCRHQLLEFQKIYPQIREKGELMAIATVSLEDIKAGKESNGLTFPLLADEDRVAAMSYGVYDKLEDGLAAPAVFISDADGLLRWSYIGRGVSDLPPARQVLAQLDRVAGR